MSDEEKIKHVRGVRNRIGTGLTELEYNQAGKGTLKDVVPFENWKKLMLSDAHLGQECFEILSDYFEVNIIIYYQDLKLYPMDIYYHPEHKNVHIYWSGNHYDAIDFAQ